MAWMRTREIKPGVYETQSAGHHAARQIGIVVGILFGGVLLIVGISEAYSGNAFPVLFFGIPLVGIAAWHISYYRRHPAQPHRPGPWSQD